MIKELRFSSKRLFLTLMLCACSIILLLNYDLDNSSSFTLRLISVFAGLALCFLLFLPSAALKKLTGADFLTIAARRTPGALKVISVIYAMYFIFAAQYFLLPYTDMFTKKYYGEVSPCVIAFLLLSACVYAACKRVNVISRFGIFLFVFALLTNALMFGGSISSLDFRHYGFELSGGGLIGNTVYFTAPAFIAVLFSCLSGTVRGFKISHPIWALLFSGIKYTAVLFFIHFSLGDYGYRQEYQTFVLSRVAHFGSYGGVESFYLALATMSVFMIISLILCCVNRGFKQSGSLKASVIFAAVILAVNLAAKYNNSLREIFTNNILFVSLTAAAAVLAPIAYIFVWRKSNAEKNLHIITEL